MVRNRNGGATPIPKEEIDDVFEMLEKDPAFSVSGVSSGGRRRRIRGGGCSPETRQRVRILVIAMIAAGGYSGGAELIKNTAMNSGELLVQYLTLGIEAIKSSECTIGLSKPAIQNLLCQKYAEMLDGIQTLIVTTKTNSGVSTLMTFVSGAGAVKMFSTFKGAVTGLVRLVKGSASGVHAGFEAIVDQICAAIKDPDAVTVEAEAVEPPVEEEAAVLSEDDEAAAAAAAKAARRAARRNPAPKGGRRVTRKKRASQKRRTVRSFHY